MTAVRSQPCSACPYRLDTPSGLWQHDEYEKLRDYDLPTPEQPFGAFACHATPEHLCHGWAVCHTNRGHEFDLLALRLDPVPVPEPGVPLFRSGNDAADWGQREIEDPPEATQAMMLRLVRKYPRLAFSAQPVDQMHAENISWLDWMHGHVDRLIEQNERWEPAECPPREVPA